MARGCGAAEVVVAVQACRCQLPTRFFGGCLEGQQLVLSSNGWLVLPLLIALAAPADVDFPKKKTGYCPWFLGHRVLCTLHNSKGVPCHQLCLAALAEHACQLDAAKDCKCVVVLHVTRLNALSHCLALLDCRYGHCHAGGAEALGSFPHRQSGSLSCAATHTSQAAAAAGARAHERCCL